MRFPVVGFGVLLLATLPAQAQLPRVEGTITQSGDGAPVRARLFFQAPSSLKIEVLGAGDEVVQTVVASGDQTQTFDARSRRLTVLNANIAREWYRGAGLLAGGPANFAFSGATGFAAEPEQGVAHIRDRVLLGTAENRSYYVASKQRVRAFPARIEIKNGVRTDFNDQNIAILHAKVVLDAQNLPQRADIGSGGDQTSFVYALKARTTEFSADTFALPDAAKDAIHEENALRAPSAYTGDSPDELWGRGMATWRASGDATEALALWARATLSNPRATAPRFASLQVALATRAMAGAGRAAEGLRPLLSEADFAWANTDLDDLRADRLALLRDLQKAATTGEPGRLLALSLAQRAAGDLDGARTIWKSLLLPSVPRAITVKAAESIVLSATPAELPALGATLEGNGEAVQLVRALLDLRGGKTSAATFTLLPFRASFARALERAGQSGAAKPLWESIESNDAVSIGGRNEARAHLITILALKGDASGALLVWNRWSPTIVFDTDRENAQNILFDAFQKAGKIDTLRVLLLNRASASAAKDADLRLNLAFQEAFGNSASVDNVLNSGFDRFPNGSFWLGRRAETNVSQAFFLSAGDNVSLRKRTQLFKSASDLLGRAITNASDPTFYTLQKSLIAIQHATDSGGVVDATELANAVDVARVELARLDASPDPDYQTVGALGWNSFPAPEDRIKTIASARRALDSAPVDGDRSTLVFAARQAMAQVYERAGDGTSSARQWVVLLDIARSADEEAKLIAALLNSMDRHKNVVGMTQLMVRVGGEHWPLDANAALLSNSAARAAASPLSGDIAQALDDLADAPDASTNAATKSAIIARVAFAIARLQQANAAVAIPGAPPIADANLERATRALPTALAALTPLAQGNDPFWATRARLLLLDSGTLADDERLDLLKKLADTQGGEPSVVLVRANAEKDPQARVKAAQTLDFRMETWRRLALDALQSGDKSDANFWSQEAFEYASSAPEVDANEFQRIGFARARVLWENGQVPAATALYNNLAGSGWNTIARAAALFGLRQRLQEAGRTDDVKAVEQRLIALTLSKSDAGNALSLLAELDG